MGKGGSGNGGEEGKDHQKLIIRKFFFLFKKQIDDAILLLSNTLIFTYVYKRKVGRLLPFKNVLNVKKKFFSVVKKRGGTPREKQKRKR